MASLNTLISEIRSAREAGDYEKLVSLLDEVSEERADDVAAYYPYARPVWWVLAFLQDGEFLDAAQQLCSSCGEERLEEALPDGFAPVLGHRVHQSFLTAREEDPDSFRGTLALALPKGERVVRLVDDERPFTTVYDPETGEATEGLEDWGNLFAVVFDGDAHGGKGEARAYISAPLAAEIALEGQECSCLEHPVYDKDEYTKVLVLPTLDGWRVWVF
jgi:hypothetical protein